jgi:YD repeat-containing protein
MPDQLEAPNSSPDLYLARGIEVNVDRPLLQGDVVADVEIPGVDDGPGVAAILTHPCAMRSDGVRLEERLLVARVELAPDVPFSQWGSGHYKVMPLPELLTADGQSYALKYDLCGRVRSQVLAESERLACLDPFGICLLLQRKVHHESRVIIPTSKFHEACAAVFEEVDLVEEWLEAARAAGADLQAAAEELHAFIREPRAAERTLQEALHDPSRRGHVRRIVRQHMQERYGVETA